MNKIIEEKNVFIQSKLHFVINATLHCFNKSMFFNCKRYFLNKNNVLSASSDSSYHVVTNISFALKT